MKGAYCLLINIKKPTKIKIGSLGKTKFDQGKYVYIGSALNNLEKRIARHLRKNKKKFWHIDYLLASKNANVEKVAYKESKRKEECETAKKIAEYSIAIKNFGCSDCKCKSHLFKVKSLKWHVSGMKSAHLENLNKKAD